MLPITGKAAPSHPIFNPADISHTLAMRATPARIRRTVFQCMTMDNCGGEEVKRRHIDCAAAAELYSIFENGFPKSAHGDARRRLEDKPPYLTQIRG
jgi:hypothetical protein